MIAFEKSARAFVASRQAEGTRYLYGLDLGRWLWHCRKEENDPADPELECATSFRDNLAKRVSAISVRRSIDALCSIYEFATEGREPVAKWNPFKKLPRPPVRSGGRTEAISAREAMKLIKVAEKAEAYRDRAILWLLYATGMRRGSVATLLRKDVIHRDDQMIVRLSLKGGREGEVEIPILAACALHSWMNWSSFPESSSRYVFPGRHRRHLHPSVINKMINKYAKAAGLKDMHPHRFRASYVTAALDAGVALHDVQAAVHHASPDMTLRYDRGKRGQGVADAVAKFRGEP